MKCFLIAAISLMSFSSFAQSTSTESRIELRLERLNDLVQRERAHRFLSEAQKTEVLRNINAAILMIRADQNPNPNPNRQQPDSNNPNNSKPE